MSFFFTTFSASANDIGATSCTEVRAIMDDIENRNDDFLVMAHWMLTRFKVDDDSWRANGHESLVNKWSEKGLEGNLSMVSASCAEHRNDTLAQRTDSVFLGIGTMELQFGAVK